MKVVHIITSLGVGGAEKLLVNVANRQSVLYDVTIIFFKVDTLVNHFDSKINVIHIPLNIKIVRTLKKELYKIQPDIVHTHLTHADLFGSIAARKLEEIKLFTTIHNTKYRHNQLDYVYYFLYMGLFKFIVPKSRVIAISKSVEEILRSIIKLPSSRISLLYNTVSEYNRAVVDSKLIHKIKDDNRFKILFVGRLTLQKSVQTLIKAISNLPSEIKNEITVYIVGKGPLKDDLLELSKELKVDNIISFEGEKENPEPYFKNADIFVLPSVFEGLGIVLLEAFKYKVPVIASNIDGPSELIEDNTTGLLFEVENYEALSQKICELYVNSSLRKNLINNAYKKYSENFSPEIYMQKLNNIYFN